jgi:glycosyltransferase involved in cell wall biosynthesis
VDVSVVTPTFQRCSSVARILDALADQALPPTRFEVIVAIDGSDDRTREMLADRQTPFELRSMWRANRGRAAACNSGIRTARARPLEKSIAGRLDAHMRRLSQPGHRFTTRDFYSGNASARRDVLMAVGLYDESSGEYGNEDLELAVRLRTADVEIEFSPQALAVQRYEKSFRQLAAETT